MFQTKPKVSVISLAGLALAVMAVVAVNKWHSDQQPSSRAQAKSPSTPRVVAVEREAGRVSERIGAKETKGSGHIEPSRMLEASLSRLHAEAVAKFIMTPGRGFSRTGGLAQAQTMVFKEWKVPWWSPGELDQETAVAEIKDLELIHKESLKDFNSTEEHLPPKLNTQNFFLFMNRKPVAGGREKNWDLKALDLVGLLKHKEPVVYLSEKLADMKDLKDTATRPLDLFEFAGLEAIQKGDPLFVRAKDGAILMLGAIRAGKQCLSCHDDKKEGDLLGAFSYTLRLAE